MKKQIIFIRDSFSLALASYFSLMVKQLDMIDVRTENENFGNFDGSIKSYIKQTKPDFVILLYDSKSYEFN